MTEHVDSSRWTSESLAFRQDIADFGAFYERTYGSAYRTALGIVREAALAADVTQEAYVAAYRHRDRFRGEAPSTAWLHRIVVNQALAVVRRRREPRPVRDLSPAASADESGDTVARMALLTALEVLPPRHRAAVILRYYHDYDYATIARFLNTTPTNVGAMLSRALDRLKLEVDQPRVQGALGVSDDY
jgi:RNA polymerase sigma-70 factor (ECF subfamily)